MTLPSDQRILPDSQQSHPKRTREEGGRCWTAATICKKLASKSTSESSARRLRRLNAKVEAVHHALVLCPVLLHQVFHEPRALAEKDAQPPLACVVLLVDEQVLGKTLDTLGKEGDLERGRAGVVGTGLEHLDGLVVQVGAGHLVRRNNLEALSARGHRARAHVEGNRGPTSSHLEPCDARRENTGGSRISDWFGRRSWGKC